MSNKEPIRVFIVDDDVEICSLIKYRLTLGEDAEFDVMSMSKGFDRLSAPGTFKAFDCLLLDLWLLPKDITEEYPMAHKIFRWAREDNPEMPIIIFSAVIGFQFRQDIEDEAELVVSKPSIDKLGDIVRTITHRRRVGDWEPVHGGTI